MMDDIEPESDEGGYGPVCPFWIDTAAYSQRDREMFCYGFEFATILHHLEHDDGELSRPIHRENESRTRMACGRFKRRYSIEACDPKDDPGGTWSYLTVESRA